MWLAKLPSTFANVSQISFVIHSAAPLCVDNIVEYSQRE